MALREKLMEDKKVLQEGEQPKVLVLPFLFLIKLRTSLYINRNQYN